MTKEEFKIIIAPLGLLDREQRNFMVTALAGNFDKWEEKQCVIPVVGVQSEQLCEDEEHKVVSRLEEVYRCSCGKLKMY